MTQLTQLVYIGDPLQGRELERRGTMGSDYVQQLHASWCLPWVVALNRLLELPRTTFAVAYCTLCCTPLDPLQVSVAASLNCSAGSYYSDVDNSCKECGICPESEVEAEPCTPTWNTICHCKPGYYRLYPTWSFFKDTCQECRRCGNRQVVINCTESSDTLCGDCPLDYFLYNATFCAACSICSEGDPFAIRMIDCQEAGLPPWQQCAPQMVTDSVFVFNTSYVPSVATQSTFVSSSTVDAVNDGDVQNPTEGIIIAGWMTASLSVLMLAVCCCTCACCLWSVQHCALSRRHETVSDVTGCCPQKCTQRLRTSSGTQTVPTTESDAVPLPLMSKFALTVHVRLLLHVVHAYEWISTALQLRIDSINAELNVRLITFTVFGACCVFI